MDSMTDSGGLDVGIPDDGIRGCLFDAECGGNGYFCRWWSPGCHGEAVFGDCSTETALDACAGGCNDYCDCAGVTRNGWAIGPFAHHGACVGTDGGGSD